MHWVRICPVFFVVTHLGLAVYGNEYELIADTATQGCHVLKLVACTNEVVPVLIGRVLGSIQSVSPKAVPSVKLMLRDTKVSATSTSVVFRTDDLIAYAKREACPLIGECERAQPRISLMMQDVTFSRLLEVVASVAGYRVSVRAGNFEIGPPELVGDHPALVRRAYLVPSKTVLTVTNVIPTLLQFTGPAAAYDEKNGILNLIGDPVNLEMFEDVLLSIGAKRLNKYNGGPPEL